MHANALNILQLVYAVCAFLCSELCAFIQEYGNYTAVAAHFLLNIITSFSMDN